MNRKNYFLPFLFFQIVRLIEYFDISEGDTAENNEKLTLYTHILCSLSKLPSLVSVLSNLFFHHNNSNLFFLSFQADRIIEISGLWPPLLKVLASSDNPVIRQNISVFFLQICHRANVIHQNIQAKDQQHPPEILLYLYHRLASNPTSLSDRYCAVDALLMFSSFSASTEGRLSHLR